MMMPKEIASLVHELQLIGEDKITQPNGESRRAAARAARIIKQLYEDNEEISIDQGFLDSEAARRRY